MKPPAVFLTDTLINEIALDHEKEPTKRQTDLTVMRCRFDLIFRIPGNARPPETERSLCPSRQHPLIEIRQPHAMR